ncbi:MAG TPA: response regulator transcription factor [Gaiellaceae bacterium]|jgi:DNA-binding NarL/FixJ family response regulator
MGSRNAIGVLIADDHDQFVSVLEAILVTEKDLAVLGVATDGEEAVELSAELEPDVVLMDISMPVMDGFEATRRIRATRPGTNVIIVTGSSAEEDRAQAREVGAVAYVQKERILEELAPAVRSAADGQLS